MFDYLFAQKVAKQEIIFSEADKYIPLIWSEHCVECSAPLCYKSCKQYEARKDGNCVRISGGISAAKIDGVVCTRVNFRKWAKIESPVFFKELKKKKYKHIIFLIGLADRCIRAISQHLPRNLGRFLTDAEYSLRRKLLKAFGDGELCRDFFLILKIKSSDSGNINLEIKTPKSFLFRTLISLDGAENEYVIPVSLNQIVNEALISLYPEDVEKPFLMNIEYLELTTSVNNNPKTENNSNKKVKCVIWDLDNTVWDGILVESSEIKLRQEIVDIIKDLDAKGIVNSISSKNNEETAVAKLKEFAIDEYFVFKHINWSPKSVNVQSIIKGMNIAPDTIVFVDDNIFEREEVKSKNPDVTVVDVKDIARYVKCDRFDVTVTEVNILVQEYRCSGGTETANPAAGNRCSETGIPHLVTSYLCEFTRLKLDLIHILPAWTCNYLGLSG